MEDRDRQVLQERIGGATLREIGEQHDLTAEGVRLVVVRAAREHVDQSHALGGQVVLLADLSQRRAADALLQDLPVTVLHIASSSVDLTNSTSPVKGGPIEDRWRRPSTSMVARLSDPEIRRGGRGFCGDRQ